MSVLFLVEHGCHHKDLLILQSVYATRTSIAVPPPVCQANFLDAEDSLHMQRNFLSLDPKTFRLILDIPMLIPNWNSERANELREVWWLPEGGKQSSQLTVRTLIPVAECYFQVRLWFVHHCMAILAEPIIVLVAC